MHHPDDVTGQADVHAGKLNVHGDARAFENVVDGLRARKAHAFARGGSDGDRDAMSLAFGRKLEQAGFMGRNTFEFSTTFVHGERILGQNRGQNNADEDRLLSYGSVAKENAVSCFRTAATAPPESKKQRPSQGGWLDR